MPDKIEVASVTSPGQTVRPDRAKYEAMRAALLSVLPREAPGSTVAEAKTAVLPALPGDLFPGGAKAGWWLKAVQLDLEAKSVIVRGPKSPVRVWRIG